MTRKLDVTVVVPTLGRVDQALGLASHLERLNPAPKEVFFIFQVEEELHEWSHRVSATLSTGYFTGEKGAGHARNFGAQLARSEFVIFLDDDCEPLAVDWLEQLLIPLRDTQVVLSTGPVRGWDSASTLFSKGRKSNMLATSLLIPWGNPDAAYSGECDTVVGGNFAVAREDFVNLGGFSDLFRAPSLFEETELSVRFSRATNRKVWFTHRAPVHHEQSALGGMRFGEPRFSDNFILSQKAILLKLTHESPLMAELSFLSYKMLRLGYSKVRSISGWLRARID